MDNERKRVRETFGKENETESSVKRKRSDSIREALDIKTNYVKVVELLEREFHNEISNKEKEIQEIQRRLLKAQKRLHLLKYVVVKSFYENKDSKIDNNVNSSQRDSRFDGQSRIHPAVKQLLGKKPVNCESFSFKQELPSTSKISIDSVSEDVQTNPENLFRINGLNEQSSSKNEVINNVSRNREKTKYRIVVGNISKFILTKSKHDNSTHKWMAYVRGPKEQPDISHIVKKVRFFLHPSYKPNDIIDVEEAPFHLSRRGWGEFPLRIQIHFQYPENKPVDVIHNLKLDRTYTGRQTLGNETFVDVWLSDASSNEQSEENSNELNQEILNKQNEGIFSKRIDGIFNEQSEIISIENDEDSSEKTLEEISTEKNGGNSKTSKENSNRKTEENFNENTEEYLNKKSDGCLNKIFKEKEKYVTNSNKKEMYLPDSKLISNLSENHGNKIEFISLNILDDEKSQVDRNEEILLDVPEDHKSYFRKNLEMENFSSLISDKDMFSVIDSEYIIEDEMSNITMEIVCDDLHIAFNKMLEEKPPLPSTSKSGPVKTNWSQTNLDYSFLEDHCYTKHTLNENKYKIVLPYDKFETTGQVLICLFKKLPLVTELAEDWSYLYFHPYVAKDMTEYSSWNPVKRTCSEWFRAKVIKQILEKNYPNNKYDFTAKTIMLFGRIHAFTPLVDERLLRRFYSYQTYMKSSSKNNIISTYTQHPLFGVRTEKKRRFEEKDCTVDIENVESIPEIQPAKLKIYLPHEEDDDLCKFVGLTAGKLGIRLAPEEISPGVFYNLSEKVMLHAVKCMAEELIRRSYANNILTVNQRNSNGYIGTTDVAKAILSRPEFDIFSNEGLGKNTS